MLDDWRCEHALEGSRRIVFCAASRDGVAKHRSNCGSQPPRGFVPAARFDHSQNGQNFGSGYLGDGRAPKTGLAGLKSHSSLSIVRSALASRRFLSNSSAVMASKVLADAAALAALVSFLASEGSCPLAKEPLGFLPSLAGLPEAGRRVDPNSEQFLGSLETVSETPALRAVRHDP
jgi:hypothetical protein